MPSPGQQGSTGTTAPPIATTSAPQAKTSGTEDPTDRAVLEYLRKKGMGMAATELCQILKEQGKVDGEGPVAPRDETCNNDKSTSVLSGNDQLDEDDKKSILAKATGGGFGYDRDAAAPVVQWGVPDKNVPHKVDAKEGLADRMGVDEARVLLDCFTSFQIWVLSLPDHDGIQTTENPLIKAQQLIKKGMGSNRVVSLASVVENMAKPPPSSTTGNNTNNAIFHLPPSAKPELFSVAFSLLVHTYCELLEVGMESTAHVLRDTFRSVYEPLYAKEFADLFHCNTTEDMMRLNSHNAQHMEALSTAKNLMVQVSGYQQKRDEMCNADGPSDPTTQAAKQVKLQEYDRTIGVLQQKYTEISQRASLAFHKMHDLPFLRRARAVRWQLSMSTATYSLLSSFLNAQDTSLLAMSTLLQTKCELHVERRDPLPFTPACVLDDKEEVPGNGNVTLELNKSRISWAAPLSRQRIEFSSGEKLPFPKFYLEEEYDDETKAKEGKKVVEFNRALLVNGFRRLEALERKHEHGVLPKMKIAKQDYHHHATSRETANPIEPTILMSTLCSTASAAAGRPSPMSSSNRHAFDTAAIWEESGIGLCCAKICPPDGRQVAVGCDDSAVRIWNLVDANKGKEPAQVLLGHKNGFPVFDVSWNRDGRSLLSAAGDGSVRLWDTKAVGYFSSTAALVKQSRRSSAASKAAAAAASVAANNLEDMNVPGLKTEDSDYASGAALAVYRGHAPSTPVWSVEFAPCGYYFATAGADATIRLWTTDRELPWRLFTGHTSMMVNCVDWHPNCNYIISGSEDKTARLWDVHSGRTVRLLNGCPSGINVIKASPCGKYAAGGDNGGSIHLWDLGTGLKVTEFRSNRFEKDPGISMVHALSFSACGSSLASGGDDCYVHIWDVKSTEATPVTHSPVKSFATRQALIMDLQYNKRNLLLSVSKFATPVPSSAMIAD